MAEGKIVQCIGAVVDVEFPRNAMPKIYDALTMEGTALTLEVQQQLGDGIVRTIALGTSDGLRRGMMVQNTGKAITVPVGKATLGRIMDVLGNPIDDCGPVSREQSAPIHRKAPAYDELSPSLDTPLDFCFDYRWCPQANAAEAPAAALVGQLALVPFGRREVVGLIVAVDVDTEVPDGKLKDVLAIRCQLAPLSPQWQALCAFAADYYQRPLGEVALPGLPKNLRVLKTTMLDRALKKLAKAGVAHDATPAALPVLNAAQQHAADVIAASQGFAPYLLYGITGSGKTEVYLQAAANILARNDDAQILILVPEINLTPQLEASACSMQQYKSANAYYFCA